MSDPLELALDLLNSASRVAILTGAGVSKASGIPTFRDGPDAWWGQVNPLELLTQSSFDRDPLPVWGWHQHKRRLARRGSPNAAHEVFARLERRPCAAFTLATQNIDGLHTLAGSRDVIELHGSVHRARCEVCDEVHDLDLIAGEDEALPRCPSCGAVLRPDVVWFGDQLDEGALLRVEEAFATADVAVVAGTSAKVYPAAALPVRTARGGGQVIEINPERTGLSAFATLRVTQVDWAERLLALLGPCPP